MDYNLATLVVVVVVVVVEARKHLTTSFFLIYSLEVGYLTTIRGQLPEANLEPPGGTPYC